MGKRRKTAKTGDKALYRSGGRQIEKSTSSTKDDPMYDEIETFHNKRDEDFLRLDAGDNSSEEGDPDDGISRQEAVMDLGASLDDDESSSESDDSSSASEENAVGQAVESNEEDEEVSLSSEDSDDDKHEYQIGDPRKWGKKKGAYYHGDTADLEIGQDEEDAFLEEEAAKEVQSARLKQMKEDDFMLSGDEEEEDDDNSSRMEEGARKAQSLDVTNSAITRDLSKLSNKDKRKLLATQHPELLPIVSYFSDIVKDLKDNTMVATKALMDGEKATAEAVGATRSGQQYLVTKALLQSTMALNVTMYLLLKGEQQSMTASESHEFAIGGNDKSTIQDHPVMARLEKLNSLAQKLEDKVESKVKGLPDQISNLVKASALMKSEELGAENESDEDDGDKVPDQEIPPAAGELSSEDDGDDSDSSQASEQEIDEEKHRRQILNEAKFGLREKEVASTLGKPAKRKRRGVAFEDFVDQVTDSKSASSAFASTINAIEQRASSKSRKRRAAPVVEQLDALEDDDDELRRGLEMMEQELGRGSDEDDSEGSDDISDHELDDDDQNDFYAQVVQKSKAKKKFKQSLYQVAPKFPGTEKEVEGERPLSRAILKNRGLVAHKNKLNRNPRVKKREQYRKALIRRRGAVRDIRTDEGHKYGGEATGIKSGLSRSRKLASS